MENETTHTKHGQNITTDENDDNNDEVDENTTRHQLPGLDPYHQQQQIEHGSVPYGRFQYGPVPYGEIPPQFHDTKSRAQYEEYMQHYGDQYNNMYHRNPYFQHVHSAFRHVMTHEATLDPDNDNPDGDRGRNHLNVHKSHEDDENTDKNEHHEHQESDENIDQSPSKHFQPRTSSPISPNVDDTGGVHKISYEEESRVHHVTHSNEIGTVQNNNFDDQRPHSRMSNNQKLTRTSQEHNDSKEERRISNLQVEEVKEDDPVIIAQNELIEKSTPSTELEIALHTALQRKENHIRRLSKEIRKLKQFVVKRKQTYRRKRKENDAPIKPLSAYNIFIRDRFAQLAKENENALNDDDVDTQLKRVPPSNLISATGNAWKELSREEKQKYEERYVRQDLCKRLYCISKKRMVLISCFAILC
jgi:HMG (high mobility group) box